MVLRPTKAIEGQTTASDSFGNATRSSAAGSGACAAPAARRRSSSRSTGRQSTAPASAQDEQRGQPQSTRPDHDGDRQRGGGEERVRTGQSAARTVTTRFPTRRTTASPGVGSADDLSASSISDAVPGRIGNGVIDHRPPHTERTLSGTRPGRWESTRAVPAATGERPQGGVLQGVQPGVVRVHPE